MQVQKPKLDVVETVVCQKCFGVQTNAHFTERLLSKTFPTLSSPLAHLFPKWRVEGFVAEEKPLKATKWGKVPTL